MKKNEASLDHTFVICAYKESGYLEECIKSLVNQTMVTNVILYTSTPNYFIEDLCNKYGIKMFHSQGGSIGKDWNNALSFVETQYATIAHQDDYYEPQYAERIMSTFQQNQDTLIAFSDYREWKNGDLIPRNTNLKIKKIMLNTMKLFPNSKFWRNRILAFGNPICCPAVSYNLTLLSGFRFSETMRVSLDWSAWYDISQYEGSFRYVNEELMYHRIHEESETSNTISDNTRTKEDMEMYSKLWPQFIAQLLMKFYIKSQDSNS